MSDREKDFINNNPDELHTFERVVTKAWSINGADRIKNALSNFLKKQGISIDTSHPTKLTKEQSALLKRFWAANEWAQKLFSKNMKYSWKKVKEENETFYPIKIFPKGLVRFIETKAGIEADSLNVNSNYNPYTNKSYYDKSAERIFNEHASKIENLGDILADTYFFAIRNLANNVRNAREIRNNKKYQELSTMANLMLNSYRDSSGKFVPQNTKDVQAHFAYLACKAAESRNERLVEMINQSLDNSFQIAMNMHTALKIFGL